MPAPKAITDLVRHFEAQKDAFKSGKYNETQLRREFLDPFFETLGWDVQNKKMRAAAYKDVIHEDTVKVGTMTKAPDYSFRVGGVRKFFVEAKKPAVNIKTDVDPSFQLRRYGWSAKLPLSILTDFEEFVIYDCRTKPKKTDSAAVGRILYLTCNEYVDRWDEIAGIFSHEAILQGSFDAFADKTKTKRGVEGVDDAFLKEIEEWRELLAKNIAIRNPELTQRALNYAVQQTIDRIVFLRICEDRGTEEYGRLLGEINGSGIYGRLKKHFHEADARYNSGLFHFNEEKDQSDAPDTLTLGLGIDDEVLKKIISRLYYPESPYEFSVLPAEILGQVYEQFLGKVIRLTEGHHAKVEEKPEVRKAGGVYYTPPYIVRYIVEHTVGKLLEGKTPKQVEKIRIVDPACGSGSFLLGTYQYLLDWHLRYYLENDPKKYPKALFSFRTEDGTEEWRLSTPERKRILLNNIFGVDIDAQAVEVTKLSLLLKVLEGETDQSLQGQFAGMKERALPNLGSNIKCGNSLIGPDFYATEQRGLFGDEETYRINAFDWERAFPQVFTGKDLGFDAVIGNPPWGAWFGEEERNFLSKRYSVVPSKTKDSYFFFVMRSLSLLGKKGFLGFIVPNTWLLINNAKDFRKALLGLDIQEITDYGDGVFKDATVESATFILRNEKKVSGTCRARRIKKQVVVVDHSIDKSVWFKDSDFRIIVDLNKESVALLEKLDRVSEKFDERCDIIWGIKPYQVGHGEPPQTREMLEGRIYHSETKKGVEWKPLLVGKNVNRYSINFSGDQYIRYGKWLMYPSNEEWMLKPKILLRQTSDIIRACYDDESYYCQNSVFIINSKEINLKFLLGLLNSQLLNFVYKLQNPQSGKVFAEIKPSIIKKLPIYKVDQNNIKSKTKHNRVVELVEKILLLNKQLPSVKTPHESEMLQRQIEATDREINEVVYTIYGISDSEKELIASAIS